MSRSLHLVFLVPLVLLPACGKRAEPPPEQPPAVVILPDPSRSMTADDGTAPPPRLVPPTAEPSDAEDAMEVFAIAAPNEVWKFQYENGMRERNELHLPVGRSVKLTLAAEETAPGLRRLEIPAFPLIADAWAGRYSQSAVVKPTRTGEFGLWGARERVGTVVVLPVAEFDAWLLGFGSPQGKDPADGSLAHAGRQLFLKLQWVNCHGAATNGKGPTLEGLYGTKVALKSGGAEIADDFYITESIRRPKLKVVAGWEAIMPAYDKEKVSDEELNALVAYIRSLKRGDLNRKEERFPAPAGAPKEPPPK